MKNADKADESIVEFAKTVFYTFPTLVDADVRIEYLTADELSHNGYPAAALIKILSEEQRAAGCQDARIIIDNESWADRNEEERRALIHHEMLHIIPILNKPSKDGTAVEKYKSDNLGRPKLKLRKHDYFCGGFYENIEKFQESSPDLQNLIAINKALREKKILTQSQMWG